MSIAWSKTSVHNYMRQSIQRLTRDRWNMRCTDLVEYLKKPRTTYLIFNIQSTRYIFSALFSMLNTNKKNSVTLVGGVRYEIFPRSTFTVIASSHSLSVDCSSRFECLCLSRRAYKYKFDIVRDRTIVLYAFQKTKVACNVPHVPWTS